MWNKLKVLIDAAKNARKAETVRIPEVAQGDPVAEQTSWRSLRSSGANFQTHRLVEEAPHTMRFVASIGAILFCSIFIVMGVGIAAAFGLHSLWTASWKTSPEILIPVLFGLVFAGFGGGFLYAGMCPITFDKHMGYFWKGRTRPIDVFDVREMKNTIRLEDIHAIQLLRKYVHGSNSGGYYSYEINLVLHDGERLNVVDHGKLKAAQGDALRLSQWLEIPLWDTVSPCSGSFSGADQLPRK